jgi:P-type Cu2+ transporter
MTHYSVFTVEGMHCSNCARTVEKSVGALRGVTRASVNASTAHASVEWDRSRTSLKEIFAAVRTAGYTPIELAEETADAARLERRSALKRIGIAGLGMMQTMMFVYALYAGGAHGIDPNIEQYLRLTGMLFATPVLFYSGFPFFAGALRDIRRRTVGMDVPVAGALALAYTVSVFNTLRGRGQIYYDSVTMFVFFLAAGRYLEMIVRQRSLNATDALSHSLPATAAVMREDGSVERVPLSLVKAGDRLSIAKGAVIPVDGSLLSQSALVDESLITGESTPLTRRRTTTLLGGSINIGHPIELVTRATAADSTLAGIVELLQKAQAERPSMARTADRAASIFSLTTLVLATVVAVCWSLVDPSKVLPATLAVLVITCPCALSLATPATVAAATTRLSRSGVLVLRPDALERLARADTVVLDKTGTLTRGLPVASTSYLVPGRSEEQALAVAAALERSSEHPLASAFAPYALATVTAKATQEYAGRGIQGMVAGHTWRLGQREFVAELCPKNGVEAGIGGLVLGNDSGVVAAFHVRDALSEGAAAAVRELRSMGLGLVIASGDGAEPVREVAQAVGIDAWSSRVSPHGKLARVEELQRKGHRVLMIGDGVNDGPVLAGAYVSCAIAQGSAIAQAAADLLLVQTSLSPVALAVKTARAALRTMRQNLLWALVYNVSAIPLAALGWVAPWVAAIGMSMSSLIVVANAARLAGPANSNTRRAKEAVRTGLAGARQEAAR